MKHLNFTSYWSLIISWRLAHASTEEHFASIGACSSKSYSSNESSENSDPSFCSCTDSSVFMKSFSGIYSMGPYSKYPSSDSKSLSMLFMISFSISPRSLSVSSSSYSSIFCSFACVSCPCRTSSAAIPSP